MNDLLTTSLIAPLDALRFAMAYALLIGLPGYGMATLLRPRTPRSERIAFAIPCGYAIVAITGLFTAILHWHYGVWAYAALAVPAAVAGAYTALRGVRLSPSQGTSRWWLVPVGVAIIQVCAITVAFAADIVPAGFDVLAHVQWVEQSRQLHVFPLALLSSDITSGTGGFYPPVFHVLTGLVMDFAPMPAYRATFLSEVASLAMLPLALFTYTRIATGSERIGALAAIASMAFEPLPFFTLAQGLYTFAASCLIVPMVALALRDALALGDHRSAALAAILGTGLFYTHPTEFVTVALLCLALVPLMLRGWLSWLRAIGYTVAIGAAWGIAALPAVAAIHTTIVRGAHAEITSRNDFSGFAGIDLGHGIDIYLQWIYGRNVSYLLLVVVTIGIIVAIRQRRLAGLAAAQIFLAAIFIDSVSVDLLRPFYIISFPWALWERLAATHYWFTLPLAGIGLDAAARAARSVLASRAITFRFIAVSPLATLGILMPLTVSTGRAAAYDSARRVVAPADLGSIVWLAQHATRGSVVVNDADLSQLNLFDAPIDAGRWIPAVGGPTVLFWRAGAGPGSLDDRLYVLHHIADARMTPRLAHYIQRFGVRYVLYGAGVRPTGQRHLRLPALLDDHNLVLAYSSAATCLTGSRRSATVCPPTASYVFALHGNESLAGIAPAMRRQWS